jgi:copper chaperone
MNETLLEVGGMSCPSCVRHVQKALNELGDVQNVDVRLREGQVRVTHGPSVAPDALVEALQRAGYPSKPTGAAHRG